MPIVLKTNLKNGADNIDISRQETNKSNLSYAKKQFSKSKISQLKVA